MSLRDFVWVLVRRWWLIFLVTGLALGGAYAFSRHEHPVYQATATVFAHPSAVVVSPSDYSNDLSLLSYGAMSETFASLAQSKSMLHRVGVELRLAPGIVDSYSAVAAFLPQST